MFAEHERHSILGVIDDRSIIGYSPSTMAQKQLIKLACSKCKNINYWSRKNKKLVERKIELQKFCRHCRKKLPHKEVKK